MPLTHVTPPSPGPGHHSLPSGNGTRPTIVAITQSSRQLSLQTKEKRKRKLSS